MASPLEPGAAPIPGADSLLIFVLGTMFGSFLNVVVHRLPRGESLVRPGSRCPGCGTPIRPLDNIPLASFLVLRGRCRQCGARISWRYPVIELVTGLAFVVFYLKYGATGPFVRAAVLSSLLIAQAAIDLETLRLPDELSALLAVVGLGYAAVGGWQALGSALLGALAGAAALGLIALVGRGVFRKEAMGMGDIKLAAACGTFLGWAGALLSLYLAFLLGSLVLLPTLIARRVSLGQRVPFGPFICAGVVAYLAGGDVARAWLSQIWP